MTMRAWLGAIGVGCVIFAGTACSAATIEPVQGNLSINQGQGFRPVSGRSDAAVGDSVMVSPGGAARIVYSDGCKVDVRPGAVATVAPLSPCASGSYAQDGYGNVAVYVFGALVATATGLAIYEIVHNNNSPAPTSP